MGCLLSVIIPAYNSEKYIERCISSALKCDADIEVIVVNDGSVDSTEEVVLNIANEDSRVKCYSQSNQGVSSARNAGLKHANGKYVVFSDADDSLQGENLSQLIDFAEKNKADVVAFTRVNSYPDGTTVNLIPVGETLDIPSDYEKAFRKTILNQPNYGWSSCNKLFRRDIIVNCGLEFIDYKTINSEDRLFNLGYLMNAKRVAFYDKCSFINFVRNDSLSHSSSFPEPAKRNVRAFEYVCTYIENLPENVKYKLLKHYFVSFVNNVVVLELSVNKAGSKKSSDSFYKVIDGMQEVLEKRKLSDKFRNEKGIYYSDGGLKYKMLNALILNHRLYWVARVLLFSFVRISDVKAKGKGK